jgi:hypothetical protein
MAARISMRLYRAWICSGASGCVRERLVDVVDPVLEHPERLGQLGEHLRMRPHEVDAVAAATSPW